MKTLEIKIEGQKREARIVSGDNNVTIIFVSENNIQTQMVCEAIDSTEQQWDLAARLQIELDGFQACGSDIQEVYNVLSMFAV